jgi:hypothetical protein
MAAFSYGVGGWVREPSVGLEAHLQRALKTLRGLTVS